VLGFPSGDRITIAIDRDSDTTRIGQVVVDPETVGFGHVQSRGKILSED